MCIGDKFSGRARTSPGKKLSSARRLGSPVVLVGAVAEQKDIPVTVAVWCATELVPNSGAATEGPNSGVPSSTPGIRYGRPGGPPHGRGGPQVYRPNVREPRARGATVDFKRLFEKANKPNACSKKYGKALDKNKKLVGFRTTVTRVATKLAPGP